MNTEADKYRSQACSYVYVISFSLKNSPFFIMTHFRDMNTEAEKYRSQAWIS